MILWLILAAMTLVAVAVLLVPLLRRPAALAPRSAYDLSVYRQQLVEIDRDLERGLLSEAEAGAARLEVERRLLHAAEQPEGAGSGEERSKTMAAVALAALLPILAFLGYQQLGAPQLAERLMAEGGTPGGATSGQQGRTQAGGAPPGLSSQQVADVETMIARLAERALSAPDDLETWLRLGRAYALTGRPAEAVEAFRQAMRLGDGRPDIASEYGESLVLLNGGQVVAEARDAFAGVLEAQPQEPRSRYYLALAAAQDGDWQAALERWSALAEDSAPTAPWLPALRQRLVEAAQALGLDPAGLPVMAKLEQAAPEEQVTQAQIEDMVAGLAARLESDPRDLEGWLMLARSYKVLGRPEQAQAAINRAAEVFAEAPFLRQQIASTARELGLEPPSAAGSVRGPSGADVADAMAMPEEDRNAMIRSMVDGLATRLESEPDDLQGWVMLLRSYRVLGEEELLAESLARARVALAERPEARAEIERLAAELGLEPAQPAIE